MNWKVRLKNYYFWMALIPAIVLSVQAVAAIFGWTLDLAEIQDKIIAAFDAVFAVLVIVGVVNDPTTAGLKDSERAMGYSEPHSDATGYEED